MADKDEISYITFVLGADLLPANNQKFDAVDEYYDKCKNLAIDFYYSNYNDGNKPLYDCLESYVKEVATTKKENIVDWVNEQGYYIEGKKCGREVDAIEFIMDLDNDDPRKEQAFKKFPQELKSILDFNSVKKEQNEKFVAVYNGTIYWEGTRKEVEQDAKGIKELVQDVAREDGYLIDTDEVDFCTEKQFEQAQENAQKFKEKQENNSSEYDEEEM